MSTSGGSVFKLLSKPSAPLLNLLPKMCHLDQRERHTQSFPPPYWVHLCHTCKHPAFYLGIQAKIQPIPPENHQIPLFCESLGCIWPIHYEGASSIFCVYNNIASSWDCVYCSTHWFSWDSVCVTVCLVGVPIGWVWKWESLMSGWAAQAGRNKESTWGTPSSETR